MIKENFESPKSQRCGSKLTMTAQVPKESF